MKFKHGIEEFRLLIITYLIFQLLFNTISVPILFCQADQIEFDYKVENRTDILPYPFSRGSAVWVTEQQAIYIFGGRNETDMLDRIMRYDPVEDELEILETKLPTVLMGSTAVYNGEFIYIFGGKDYDDFYDTILRFDPGTENITTMAAHLPNPTVGAAAVWTGEYIYFFGGSWGATIPQKFDSILCYDPIKDNITVMSSKLTFGRSGLAATWDGKYIYIVGGSDGKLYSDEVFKYSPENDTLITLPGKLPSGRLHIQTEYHEGSLYIFGGRGSHTAVYKQILRYDLETNNVELLEQKLPNPTEFRMHAYDEESIFLIGGFAGEVNINQFIKFTPEESDTEDSGPSCPPENPYEIIVIITSVLVFVIIVTIINRYRKKK